MILEAQTRLITTIAAVAIMAIISIAGYWRAAKNKEVTNAVISFYAAAFLISLLFGILLTLKYGALW